MEQALGKLEKRIASGKLKDRSKIERSLGKIQARHPSVNDLYKVAVQENSDGLRLEWKLIEERRAWRCSLKALVKKNRNRGNLCVQPICPMPRKTKREGTPRKWITFTPRFSHSPDGYSFCVCLYGY